MEKIQRHKNRNLLKIKRGARIHKATCVWCSGPIHRRIVRRGGLIEELQEEADSMKLGVEDKMEIDEEIFNTFGVLVLYVED